jgi:hypothetical protein
MNPEVAELRRMMMMSSPEASTQTAALIVSLGLVAVVLFLVRRRTLREEYTPIWIGVAVAMLVVGVNLEILRGIADLLGAWTLSSTIFFLGEVFLVAICLNYAVRLSQASLRIKTLAQELTLLRARVDDLEGGATPQG